MRITRRFGLSLAAALLTISSLPLSASDSYLTNTREEPARAMPLSGIPDGPEVDVIVELAEAPLLARRQRTQAAEQRIDDLLARLGDDLVRIERGSSRSPAASAASEPRLRQTYKLAFAGGSARVSRESLAEIRALPYVKAVHIDREMQAHLVNSVPRIRAPEVWQQYGVKGRGIVIAIIDTGIDYKHEALGKGFGPGFKVIGGYDFVNEDGDPADDNGHGTHVAGIAAGSVAPVLGVAPEAKLLAYKVLNKEGSGKSSMIIAAIERAIDPDRNGDPSDHANVINMSLGGPRSFDDPLISAVERASAAGVVVCLSAGNQYQNGAIGSPAAAPSAITVAAVEADDTRAGFSSRGPVGGSWLLKPEIAAPGTLISSAKRGGGTIKASGTSMAAPHIAGVAALVLQKHPTWTPEEVKAAIVSTGRPAYVVENPTVQSVLAGGGGRVDARSAIEATLLPLPAAVSFGLLRQRDTVFKAVRTVTLTNKGNASETATITVPATPPGVTLTASPSAVTIPAGGSAEVTLTLDLAAKTPAPNEDDFALAGWVEISGSQKSRVPWMVVNGGVVNLTFVGDDDVSLYLEGVHGVPFPWFEGPRIVGALVLEALDIAAYFSPGGGAPPRMVVRELQPVNGYTPIEINPADARYRLEFAGVDEHGIPFATRTAPGGDAESAIQQLLLMRGSLPVFFPDIEGNLVSTRGDRELWVSPMETTIIRAMEIVSTRNHDRYAMMYPVLRGVHGDQKLQLPPSDWTSQLVEHRCETAQCKVLFAPGGGSLALYTWYEVGTGPGTWRMFLTPRVAEEWDFRAYVIIKEATWTPGRSYYSYISPPFRNYGGRMSAAPFGRSKPVADYFSPNPDKPIVLTGDGPIVIRTGMGYRRVVTEPFGAALGEGVAEYAFGMKAAFYDAGGNPVSVQPLFNFGQYYLPQDQRGPHRMELSMPYRIEGRNGHLSQTQSFDNSVSFASPHLTMLRVEDGSGALSTSVPANTPARLVFAGRDTAWYEENYPFHRPIKSAETKAWWRLHGATEWQPLAVREIGTDYTHRGEMPGPAGNVFAADFSAATAAAGEIDVKISLADIYVGKTEIVYEPLLIVTPPEAKRRAVR